MLKKSLVILALLLANKSQALNCDNMVPKIGAATFIASAIQYLQSNKKAIELRKQSHQMWKDNNCQTYDAERKVAIESSNQASNRDWAGYTALLSLYASVGPVIAKQYHNMSQSEYFKYTAPLLLPGSLAYLTYLADRDKRDYDMATPIFGMATLISLASVAPFYLK